MLRDRQFLFDRVLDDTNTIICEEPIVKTTGDTDCAARLLAEAL